MHGGGAGGGGPGRGVGGPGDARPGTVGPAPAGGAGPGARLAGARRPGGHTVPHRSPASAATPSDRPSTASPSPSPTDDATAREHGRHSGSFDPPPHHQDGRPQAPARNDEQAPRSDAPPPALVEVDLCVLGRAHGGWEPDSKEAAICRAAYGR
ncbi:hypothetical protein [Streptomyces alboflavus]|uniref:hypothetical protein n=1 Tax=Streptomyces alboflavus TaxID=67267 RepID=UPI0036755F43